MARKSGNARVRRAAGDLARPARKRSAPRRAASSIDAPYHHGALRDALLDAAERVLERDGLSGLTLRAVAREAGVSHAAPTHHFGDLTGLVSELAAIGFRQFNAAMAAAGATGVLPMEKALARARAYVGYAQANPGAAGAPGGGAPGAGPEGPGAAAGAAGSGAQGKPDENVVDAEFEEVRDKGRRAS